MNSDTTSFWQKFKQEITIAGSDFLSYFPAYFLLGLSIVLTGSLLLGCVGVIGCAIFEAIKIFGLKTFFVYLVLAGISSVGIGLLGLLVSLILSWLDERKFRKFLESK